MELYWTSSWFHDGVACFEVAALYWHRNPGDDVGPSSGDDVAVEGVVVDVVAADVGVAAVVAVAADAAVAVVGEREHSIDREHCRDTQYHDCSSGDKWAHGFDAKVLSLMAA